MSEKLITIFKNKSNENIIEIIKNNLNDYTKDAQKVIIDEAFKRKLITSNVLNKFIISKNSNDIHNSKNKINPLMGIGGFLLLFTLNMIFLLVISLSSAIIFLTIDYLSSIISFILSGYLLLLLYFLFLKKKKSIIYIKIFLILNLLFELGLGLFTVLQNRETNYFSRFMALASFGIWYSYFNESIRVKNTLCK